MDGDNACRYMTRIAHTDKVFNMNEVVRHEPRPACLTARHALRARHHAPRGRRFYSNEVYAYDASGNRTSHTVGATPYAYTYPTPSPRLTAFTGSAARSYTYDGTKRGQGRYILTIGDRPRLNPDARQRLNAA